MKKYMLFLLFLLISISSFAQNKLIGNCEGCEAVFEFGDQPVSNTDTLPGFHENEPKIKISGTIYEPDGKTPAEGVILYVYHTNRQGEYATRGDEKGWAQRHGYIRSWLKTEADGRYTFYTFQPGSYSRNAAHIHPVILESDGKYYWLGSYLFEGDPNLSRRQLNQQNPRGGSNGVVKLEKEGNILVGERDITLGKNVPGYK